MKNIFAEIEHISGSIVCSFIMFDFIVCQVGYKNIVKVSSRPLLLPRIKFKKKTKRGLELVSLIHFLHDF